MRRNLAGAVAALLLAAALVGCGGEDGSGGTRPSFAPTRSPTRELPNPTRSETGEPTAPDSSQASEDTTEPRPSRTPTERPESTRATPSPSDRSDEPTSEPASSSAEGSTGADTTGEDNTGSEDDGAPSWLWWLLAALVLGAIVAIPLVRRARRRAAWRQQLSEAEAELGWLARELLPGLRHVGSREQVAGAWTVASPRVTAAEDALTVLESTAPDDLGRSRAQSAPGRLPPGPPADGAARRARTARHLVPRPGRDHGRPRGGPRAARAPA